MRWSDLREIKTVFVFCLIFLSLGVGIIIQMVRREDVVVKADPLPEPYIYEQKTLQDDNIWFGCPVVKKVNWSFFKQFFNSHTDWLLEYKHYVDSPWTEGNQYLTIDKTWNDTGFWKINLTFDCPVYIYSARFTFACDLQILDYIERNGTEVWLNYEIPDTDETYTVLFNWSDLFDIPGLIFSKGTTNDLFWFRFRRDMIPAGTYMFDPIFGYNSSGANDETLGFTSKGTSSDYQIGFRIDPDIDCTVDNISAYCKNTDNTQGTVNCTIYDSTYQRIANGDTTSVEIAANEVGAWYQFDFAVNPTLSSGQVYWLVIGGDGSDCGNNVGLYVTRDATGDGDEGSTDALTDQFPIWKEQIFDNWDNTSNVSIYCNVTEIGMEWQSLGFSFSGNNVSTLSSTGFSFSGNNQSTIDSIGFSFSGNNQSILSSSGFSFQGGNISTILTDGGFSFSGNNQSTISSVGFSFSGNNQTSWKSTGFSFSGNNQSVLSSTGFSFQGNNQSTIGSTGFSFSGNNQSSWSSTGFSFSGNNQSTHSSIGFSFSGNNESVISSIGFSFSGNNQSTTSSTGFSFSGNNQSLLNSMGFSFSGGNTSGYSWQSLGFSFSGNNASVLYDTLGGFSFQGGNTSSLFTDGGFSFSGNNLSVLQNLGFSFSGNNQSGYSWQSNGFSFSGNNISVLHNTLGGFSFSGNNQTSWKSTGFSFQGGNSTSLKSLGFSFQGGNISVIINYVGFSFSGNNVTSKTWQSNGFSFSGNNQSSWLSTGFSFSGGNTTVDNITISGVFPESDSYINSLQPTIVFNLTNSGGALMNYSIYVGNSSENCTTLLTTVNNVSDGSFYFVNYFDANSYNELFWFAINASDNNDYTNESFNFTVVRGAGQVVGGTPGFETMCFLISFIISILYIIDSKQKKSYKKHK